jgi:hypothetical protein
MILKVQLSCDRDANTAKHKAHQQWRNNTAVFKFMNYAQKPGFLKKPGFFVPRGVFHIPAICCIFKQEAQSPPLFKGI